MKFSPFFLGLLLAFNSFASECDLNFDYPNTGSNMTFFLTPSASSSILSDGTIGAFYMDNEGEYHCAASAGFHGLQTQLSVMADDATTPEKDGFVTGETIFWFFQSTDGTMHSMEMHPTDTYQLNAIIIVTELEVNELDCGDDQEDNSCETLDYNYINTGTNMTCALAHSSISSIINLGNGNLGAFYANNQGELICAGSTSITGQETVFPIMGDDTTTDEQDGLTINQELLLLLTNEEGTIYKLTPYPSKIFLVNDIYYVDHFEAEEYCNDTAEIPGCMDAAANNYNTNANVEDNSCTYDITGCTDSGSCNYNPEAVTDDGSCLYVNTPIAQDFPVTPADWGGDLANINNSSLVVINESNDLGCHTLELDFNGAIALIKRGECQFSQKALNAQNAGASAVVIYNNSYGNLAMASGDYAAEIHIPVYAMNGAIGSDLVALLEDNNSYSAQLQEHSLSLTSTPYDCNGNCVNDQDQDGICDEDEIEGCMDNEACNFNSDATDADDSCLQSELNYDCNGNCLNDADNDGICDEDEDDNQDDCETLNFDYINTGTNMTCALASPAISSIANLGNGHLGAFYTNDEGELICAGSSLITGQETVFPIMGDDATTDEQDGLINNQDLLLLFTNEQGTSYKLTAYPSKSFLVNDIYYVDHFEAVEYCNDTAEIAGCTDADANNFNSNANLDDNSCTYDVYGCTDAEANNFNSNANVEDNSCTYNQENCGCTDATYIEYFTQGYLAECDNGSCETPVQANGITSDHYNNPLNTALNSTIGFDLASSLYLPEGTVVGAFYDLNNDGQIGGSPSINSMDEVYFECVGLTDFQNNFFTMAIWGDDAFSDEVDGVPGNAEDVQFAFLLPNQSVIAFDFSPENFAFTPNGLTAYSAVNLEVTVYGCTNPASCNYNYYAEVDDGSCEGSYGCMEQMYVDYSSDASCHNQDMCADTWHDHLLVMESDYQEVMAALDSTISSNEDLSTALENQLDFSTNLEIEMAAITLSLSQANQNMTELTENLEEAAANNANLEMVNEALEEENASLTNLLNQANDALLSMESEMIEVQADMVDANLTIDEMTTSMENLNAANTEMLVEMAAANQTISNMTNAVDSLSLLNMDMQEGMLIANETISNMMNSMDSLSSINSEMEVGMTELENTNSEMSSMNESLQYELDNAEENVLNLTIQTENLLSENDSLAAPINIDLNAGWNIIGYTLRNAQDAVVSFENVIENISVVKNNSGDVYWPDFGFNGIGELLPGQGYQVLTFDAHNDFYFEDMGGLRTEIMPTIPQWAIEMEAAVHPNDVKTLVRVVNTLGQEVQPENEFEGRILYYLYNDGSVEKKVN